MPQRWRLPPGMLSEHADADDAYPGTPSSAGACSDGVDPSLSVFVEVTLSKALTGEQLGEKVVFDLSRQDEHVRGLSLGSLIAMGRRHEQAEGEAANYAYYFPDGRSSRGLARRGVTTRSWTTWTGWNRYQSRRDPGATRTAGTIGWS